MAYKDEYEVARLFSDAAFQAQLDAQFEGDYRLAFHMSPPAFFKGADGQAPRKVQLGGWMRPVLRLLAKGRALRGTFMDPFGYSTERRLERVLIGQFEARVHEVLTDVLPHADVTQLQVLQQLLALPLSMRGFGHVKLRNIEAARQREAWLLHRLLPMRYARPQEAPSAGSIRGIAVVKGAML
jgi:indolepyruvate ferredoxin oxidoreductase